MYFFTVITQNHLPKARVLAKSVKKYNKDAKFFLVFCDEVPTSLLKKDDPFDKILSIEDLGLPVENLHKWIFMHTRVELCTAVKGQAFLKIFEEKDATKVVHLDGDMVVLHNLDDLSALLDKHNIVLTPHLTEPETENYAILDNEVCSLQHGIYNLGFLAVSRTKEGKRFITWWRDRLIDYCYEDIPNGIFNDQRWIDFAPVYFDGVHILKDKTYNVACWNLTSRKVVSGTDGKLMIEGIPLKIYHFSGFDSGAQEIMLKKYCQDKPLFDLREWYIEEQNKNGQQEIGNTSSKYDVFSDKTEIKREHRVLYRTREDIMHSFPNPDVDYLQWYRNRQLQNGEKITSNKVKRFFTALTREKLNVVLKNTYNYLVNNSKSN